MKPARGSELDQASERAIGAAVDDEDDLEAAAERSLDAGERGEEVGNRLLVAIDGNYERVMGCHRGCHRLHAAATASISAAVSSG